MWLKDCDNGQKYVSGDKLPLETVDRWKRPPIVGCSQCHRYPDAVHTVTVSLLDSERRHVLLNWIVEDVSGSDLVSTGFDSSCSVTCRTRVPWSNGGHDLLGSRNFFGLSVRVYRIKDAVENLLTNSDDGNPADARETDAPLSSSICRGDYDPCVLFDDLNYDLIDELLLPILPSFFVTADRSTSRYNFPFQAQVPGWLRNKNDRSSFKETKKKTLETVNRGSSKTQRYFYHAPSSPKQAGVHLDVFLRTAVVS